MCANKKNMGKLNLRLSIRKSAWHLCTFSLSKHSKSLKLEYSEASCVFECHLVGTQVLQNPHYTVCTALIPT